MKILKIFLIIFILSSPLWFWWGINIAHRNLENYLYTLFQETALIKIPAEPELPALELRVRAATSVKINQAGEQKILFEKNIDQPLVIASLTKLMTAIIVLEEQNYYDLKTLITISEEAINQPNVPVYGNLKIVGEKRSIKELLELMLIFSSNDAVFALSEHIGKKNFIAKMNEKAKILGLENTYFVHPTGLDSINGLSNYSTTKDLVKLTKYLIKKHPLIWEILSIEKMNLYELELVNTDELLNKILGTIGGKTGETRKADGCLLLVFQTPNQNQETSNESYLINIILSSSFSWGRFKEIKNLLSWLNLAHNKKITLFFDSALFLNWQKITDDIPWSRRDAHASIVFQDKIWLFGGLSAKENFDGIYAQLPHKSDVWSSEDGKNWQLVINNAPWGKRRSLQIIEFQNKLWLMGGWEKKSNRTKNDIWYSKDGINWIRAVTLAPWNPREGHTVTVFNDKIWLIGGVDFNKRKTMNDIWYSKDGINWTEVVFDIPWSYRYDHTVVVFRDKIWLKGGLNLHRQVKNDIWVSENSREWQLVTNNSLWSERHGHTSVVFKDRIWIIGGWDFQEGLNDVWFSKDGFVWQSTLTETQWIGREDHTSVVFQDKIWLMGGMGSNLIWQNDIWHSVFRK